MWMSLFTIQMKTGMYYNCEDGDEEVDVSWHI